MLAGDTRTIDSGADADCRLVQDDRLGNNDNGTRCYLNISRLARLRVERSKSNKLEFAMAGHGPLDNAIKKPRLPCTAASAGLLVAYTSAGHGWCTSAHYLSLHSSTHTWQDVEQGGKIVHRPVTGKLMGQAICALVSGMSGPQWWVSWPHVHCD